jgi:ribosomal protein L32
MSIIKGIKCDRCGEIKATNGTPMTGSIIYRAIEDGWKGGNKIASQHLCPECVNATGAKTHKQAENWNTGGEA